MNLACRAVLRIGGKRVTSSGWLQFLGVFQASPQGITHLTRCSLLGVLCNVWGPVQWWAGGTSPEHPSEGLGGLWVLMDGAGLSCCWGCQGACPGHVPVGKHIIFFPGCLLAPLGHGNEYWKVKRESWWELSRDRRGAQ